MMISNMEIIPGQRIKQHLGLVHGSTVRAKHVGRDLMASLKNIFGGELKGYTELLQESREEVINRMKQQARELNASMVFNIKLETSSISKNARGGIGSIEVLAYGTALSPVRN